MLRKVLGAAVLAASAGTGAAVVWAQPEYMPSIGQCTAMRNMQGAPVPAEHNPGVRVYPDILHPKEAQAMLKELEPVRARHGFSLITPQAAAMYRFQQSYLGRDAPPINMQRVTGRPESAAQVPAPWGYAEAFDEAKLPPSIRKLAARVRALPGNERLGRLRDVTINMRRGGFLRLDPHFDPAGDGGHVLIVGLDSDTVITFCPGHALQLAQWARAAWAAVTLADEREGVARVAEHSSWTPWDVDVLASARAMVHMQGPARYTWTHGTRLGARVTGQPGVHDWWGTPSTPVLRGPTRTSVVLAFADVEESEEGLREAAAKSASGYS